MTISSDCYFSNSMVGVPQVGGDIDVYEVHTTPKYAIGTRFERQDGTVFRYAHFGTAIASIGAVVAPDLSATNILPVAVTSVIAPSSTYQMESDPKGVYPSSRGSKYILATTGGGNTSVTADMYAGGYITLTVGSGAGYTYHIKGNTAVGDPAAGYYRLELYDRIQSADLSTSTAFTIAGSKYANLMLAVSNTASGVVSGVTMATSSTTYPWGWIQVRGVSGVVCAGLNVLAGGAGLLGPGKMAVIRSSGAVGAITSITGAAPEIQYAPIVGTCVTVGSSGGTGLISLLLE